MDDAIFERAAAIMQSRRNRAAAENDRRIEEINAKLPQLKEINDALYASGRELIKLISNRDAVNVDKKIDELKQNNLAAQKLAKKLLLENGYPEDYLDVHYLCPACRDTGYRGSEFCDCFKNLCGKLAADELNKNASVKLSSFDSFDLGYYSGEDYQTMKRIFEFSKNYARDFTPDSPSVIMFGGTGLGKTHLSLAIAGAVLEKGYGVVYDSAMNVLRKIEKEHFSREHSFETIDLVCGTDLLLLDDLGAEYESSFYTATIYNIVNSRLSAGKPTIISTNLSLERIGARYSERVASRIVALYKCLGFVGEDVRLQRKKNE